MAKLESKSISAATHLVAEFFDVVNKQPDHIAFKADGGRGTSYSYLKVKDLILRVAAILSRPEFEDHSEIGLISENRPEWGIAYLGILAAGKTVVPIDANLKENEIDYILEHAGIKVIFTSVRFESYLNDLEKELTLFSFNEGSPNYWLKDSTDQLTQVNYVNDTAVLIYTSGTTGDPKAVELTHKNLVSNLRSIKTAFCFKPDDIFISILPLHHTFEATCGFLTPLMLGSTIVYARSLKSKEILEDIKANGVTLMIGVPLLYEKMYHAIYRKIESAPLARKLLFKSLYATSNVGWKLGQRWGVKLFKHLREKAGLGTIRMFVSGGAAIPPHIVRFYNYLGFEFYQGYGMTETSPVISAQKAGIIKFGSVGKAIDGVDVKIKNPDSNGVGEIIVRGDNVTPGYRNNPQETANLIKDGWLHTGDLGRFDGDDLWITGRKKNLIVSAAGKNIYPEQIEEKLLDSHFIMESVIIGRKRKNHEGEEVHAFIVPDLEQFKADHNIDPEKPDTVKVSEVIKAEVARLNSEMADYKRIKTFDVQLEELEKTSTKKIKRFLYK